MKRIVTNTKTVIIAIIGIVGGVIWGYNSKWDTEPIVLLLISTAELIAFAILRDSSNEVEFKPTVSTTNNGIVNVNLNVSPKKEESSSEVPMRIDNEQKVDREAIIDFMKTRIKVLFIDDDKNFNVVKILKESGWRNTKSIPDVKNIDIQIIKESSILFVDINGVGKILNLQHEGLDLSLMIKQRYGDKKVVIYSANRINNAFHPAWDVCDFKLEKNALPNQFQNLVEKYSIESYNKFK